MALSHSNNLRFYINTGTVSTQAFTVLNCETDSNLDMALSLIDTTCKDSGNFEEHINGNFSATISFSGNANTDTGLDRAIDDIIGRANTLVEYKTFNLDKWSGTGTITALSITSANQDKIAYTGSFKFNGTVTKGVA